MKDIFINTEYIKLDQFLKYANIIGTGGEARYFIKQNSVLVNNEPEDRRGRKLRNGDIIRVNNKEYRIVQNGEIK
ncbi:MAG: S4 domain-containing protein YaaA [Clostridiaceae bacterium]|nr:S4 domain-containing protein YaaA [Clostridiaceae bacterium]